MAFAGHNRGKKFIPGVGYRYPDKPEPIRERKCESCGAPAWRWFSWCGYTCESCQQKRRAPQGELKED